MKIRLKPATLGLMRKAWSSASILFSLAVSALLSGILAGCAYHPGHGDRQIPGGYRAVAVPVFKNNTAEVGAEVYFTNAFIREMQRSRVGQLAPKESAQVVIEGTVDGINYIPTVTQKSLPDPDVNILNTSYAISVTATLRLRRVSDQRILWEGSFNKQQNYQTPKIARHEALTAANALYNHSAHYQNLEILASDMMIEAHDRLTENF